MPAARDEKQQRIYEVIGSSYYRQPYSVYDLRRLKHAGIDIAEFCDFDPDKVLTQAEEAKRRGCSRQYVNYLVGEGDYETLVYAGRRLIKL